MTHAVNVVVKRFYKVYVEDPNCELSESDVIDQAYYDVLNQGDNVLVYDPMDEIEEQDIVALDYGYSFPD